MNNSSISANTLFHFTETIDNLEGILRREFEPNYSLESLDSVLEDGEEGFQIAIPMVSFCDIPLSQTHNHIDTYGHYALGLSKGWGKRKGINPVLYTYKGATIASHIKSLVAKINDHSTNEFIAPMRDFISFIKPYEVDVLMKNKNVKHIRFYDEREWRYVPLIDEEDEIVSFLHKESFFNKSLKDKETEKLHRKKLSFTPNDIRYIIVNKESDILDMICKLREIKAKFTGDEVDKLITRIISMEHIKEDF